MRRAVAADGGGGGGEWEADAAARARALTRLCALGPELSALLFASGERPIPAAAILGLGLDGSPPPQTPTFVAFVAAGNADDAPEPPELAGFCGQGAAAAALAGGGGVRRHARWVHHLLQARLPELAQRPAALLDLLVALAAAAAKANDGGGGGGGDNVRLAARCVGAALEALLTRLLDAAVRDFAGVGAGGTPGPAATSTTTDPAAGEAAARVQRGLPELFARMAAAGLLGGGHGRGPGRDRAGVEAFAERSGPLGAFAGALLCTAPRAAAGLGALARAAAESGEGGRPHLRTALLALAGAGRSAAVAQWLAALFDATAKAETETVPALRTVVALVRAESDEAGKKGSAGPFIAAAAAAHDALACALCRAPPGEARRALQELAGLLPPPTARTLRGDAIRVRACLRHLFGALLDALGGLGDDLGKESGPEVKAAAVRELRPARALLERACRRPENLVEVCDLVLGQTCEVAYRREARAKRRARSRQVSARSADPVAQGTLPPLPPRDSSPQRPARDLN